MSDTPAPEAKELLVYDPDWRRRFEDEKGRLLARLGRKLLSIDHVGATSVTAMSARPIVDVLVTLHAVSDVESILPTLTGLGYAPATVHDADDLLAFERTNPSGRYRLLLCTRTMKSHARILAFRTWLRANPIGALRYEKLRRDNLATDDEAAYFAAKDQFAATALGAALASEKASPPK